MSGWAGTKGNRASRAGQCLIGVSKYYMDPIGDWRADISHQRVMLNYAGNAGELVIWVMG